MKVEILNVGDELLIGQTINTNASWMGEFLTMNGVSVIYSTVVRDLKEEILDAVDRALNRVDVVLMTGGLGPTKDDITKHTLCEYFETTLEINEEVLQRLEEYIKARGVEMLEVHRMQAALPKDATILLNDQGTASGMWFEKKGKVLISMPGVPYEMKHLLADRAMPLLKERFEMTSIYHRTIQTQGIGESKIAQRIEDIEDEIRSSGIGLAYLPSPGQVRLRLTAEKTDNNINKIADFVRRIIERLPVYVFGEGDVVLSEVLGKMLAERKVTIGTVESCTAGNLAAEIVSISGSSAYFEGSVLSYSNRLKNEFVGVSKAALDDYGAVSEQVVKEMAQRGKELLSVDYCLSTSGIAGPGGGTDEKPVGTVWIGLATPEGVIAKRFQFGNNRGKKYKNDGSYSVEFTSL